MNWHELRAIYPERWVLIEALGATTQDGQRVIAEMRLIGDFADDWRRAWEQYKTLHHNDRQREYYVLHTSKELLDIGVIDAFGHILR